MRSTVLGDDRVVLEIKAVSEVLPIHEAQRHTYLRLGRHRVGLLFNFNKPRLTQGMTRIVY